MKILKLMLVVAVPLLLLAACNKDDDASTEPDTQAAPKVNILTVFAPGQLGDMGYADLVLKGVNAIENDSTANIRLDYITANDIESLQEWILWWAKEYTVAQDGTPFSRRLLVMTELYMAKWFSTLTGSLKQGDEVLLLKASEDDIKKAAQILGDKIPVYGLNISAAGSVRYYAKVYTDFLETCKQSGHKKNIGLYRLYGDATGLYRDSIAETLQEIFNQPVPAEHILSEESGLYNTELSYNTFQEAYKTCSESLFSRAEKDPYDIFSILDFGSSNSGAKFSLMGRNDYYTLLPVMLDTDGSWRTGHFCINRHFDLAVTNWLKKWCKTQPSEMPAYEIHGDWDGYTTNNIDTLIINYKISQLNGTK